ncbi:MAG: fluoride efflux transporter FluC [Bacilli bacterium]
MIKNILFVAIGAFLGGASRYGVNLLFPSEWPVATFIVNIVGSFLIGIAAVSADKGTSPWFRPFFMTGFLGSFTTFSSFAYENITFFDEKQFFLSMMYVASSIFVGVIAYESGQKVGRN